MFLGLILLLSFGLVSADYECLCNYNDETPVMDGTSAPLSKIGTLYEFDCKPVINDGRAHNTQWGTIAFEHQKGYVKLNRGLIIQSCVGNTDENDLVTTKFPLTTKTTVQFSTRIATLATESSSRSTKPNTVITETTQVSILPFQPTTDSSTTSRPSTEFVNHSSTSLANSSTSSTTTSFSTEQITPTMRPTTISTTIPYTTPSQESTTPTHSISSTQSSNKSATQHQTTSDTQPTSTSKLTTTSAQTPTTRNKITSTIALPITSSAARTSKMLTTVRTAPFSTGNINLCPTNRRILGITSHLAQYGNSCYEWFTGRASWQHAESSCVTNGGHLVQIKDANEEHFIQQFMNNHDSQHAIWIGLYDLGHEEMFKWTSGDPVSYTNWIPGRKSNFLSHTVENCVAYIPYKQGQWDDIPCGSSGGLFGDSGETHPYMCEYKIQSGTSSILDGLIG